MKAFLFHLFHGELSIDTLMKMEAKTLTLFKQGCTNWNKFMMLFSKLSWNMDHLKV